MDAVEIPQTMMQDYATRIVSQAMMELAQCAGNSVLKVPTHVE